MRISILYNRGLVPGTLAKAIRFKVFDLKNTPAIVWGTPKMAFYFVRLKDLSEV